MEKETIKKIFGAKAPETVAEFRQAPHWSKTLTPEDLETGWVISDFYYRVMRMSEVQEYKGPRVDPGDPGYERYLQANENIFDVLWDKGMDLKREIDAGKAMTYGEFMAAGQQAVLDYMQGKGVDLGLAPFSEQVLKETTPGMDEHDLHMSIGTPSKD